MSAVSDTEASLSINRRKTATTGDDISHDAKAGTSSVDPEEVSSSEADAVGEKKGKRKAIGFFKALLIPGVIVVGELCEERRYRELCMRVSWLHDSVQTTQVLYRFSSLFYGSAFLLRNRVHLITCPFMANVTQYKP